MAENDAQSTDGAQEAAGSEAPPAESNHTGDPAELPEWARAQIAKANAEAARYRTALREASTKAKANDTAAERLAALEESQKTDAQKIAERAADAERRALASEQALIRYRVAATKGLPPELVERLQGATEEEMAADADALLKLIKPKQEMRPDPTQGARGSNNAPDMNSLLRSAAGRG